MDSTATNLFNLLVSRDYTVKTLTSQGKPEVNPGDAEMFSFDFETARNNYGTVVILLDDESNFEVYYGDNVGKNMEAEDKDAWYDFLNQLKTFATRNLLTFTLKNLNKLKYSMQGMAAINEGLFEGWSGTKRTSYNDKPGTTRLKIVHSRELGEGEQRFRNIEKLYVENTEGERFKLPFTTLVGGRAMARHVAEGGTPYDVFGQHITDMVREANILSKFVRTTRAITEDDAEQYEVVTAGRDRYQTVRSRLKSLAGKRRYHAYKESWDPAILEQDSAIVDALRGSFITTSVPAQIEEALPYIAQNIQSTDTKESTMKEFNQFANWAETVTEGTWAIPDDEAKIKKLKEILAKPLPVGVDAMNATGVLYDIIGDDELFDSLAALAEDDPEADARPVIEHWLEIYTDSYPGLEDLADRVLGGNDELEFDEAADVGARGMNKYGMSAIKTAQGFFALLNGKVVAGPFDSIEELKAYQEEELNKDVNEQLDIDTGKEQRKQERDAMLEMSAWRKLAGMQEKVYEDFTAFQEPTTVNETQFSDTPLRDREDYLEKSKALYDLLRDPSLFDDEEAQQAIQQRILRLNDEAREMGLIEMSESEYASKLEQDILEDWGSSDWSAAVKMFKEYLDQGMSIIDAAEWVVEHFEDYGEDGEPAFTAQQLIHVAAARDPEIEELVAGFYRLFAERDVKEANASDLGKEGVDWFAPADTEPYDPERDDPRDDPNYGFDRKPTKPQPTIAPGAKKTQEANAGKFGAADGNEEEAEQIVPGENNAEVEKIEEAPGDEQLPPGYSRVGPRGVLVGPSGNLSNWRDPNMDPDYWARDNMTKYDMDADNEWDEIENWLTSGSYKAGNDLRRSMMLKKYGLDQGVTPEKLAKAREKADAIKKAAQDKEDKFYKDMEIARILGRDAGSTADYERNRAETEKELAGIRKNAGLATSIKATPLNTLNKDGSKGSVNVGQGWSDQMDIDDLDRVSAKYSTSPSSDQTAALAHQERDFAPGSDEAWDQYVAKHGSKNKVPTTRKMGMDVMDLGLKGESKEAQQKKVSEAGKPDFLDLDKDGDKKEPMKQAARDAEKKGDKELDERSLTKGEEKKREKYVKGMKKSKADFKKRYGKRGEEVMYATATKMAKEGEGETSGGTNVYGKGIYESLTELENDLDLELGHGITATSQLDNKPVDLIEPEEVGTTDIAVVAPIEEPKEKNLGDKIADKGAELSAQIDAALADIKRLAGMGN